ncbi:hypothetical protein GE09DRAFT_1145977, partial [Coniochaeta sp. 2T2.1]
MYSHAWLLLLSCFRTTAICTKYDSCCDSQPLQLGNPDIEELDIDMFLLDSQVPVLSPRGAGLCRLRCKLWFKWWLYCCCIWGEAQGSESEGIYTPAIPQSRDPLGFHPGHCVWRDISTVSI